MHFLTLSFFEVERLWKQQDQYIDQLEVIMIIKENEKKCAAGVQVLSSDRRSERASGKTLTKATERSS